jgi:hypothetical protein
VPEAKPPMPFVQSHSRDSATGRLPHTSRPQSSKLGPSVVIAGLRARSGYPAPAIVLGRPGYCQVGEGPPWEP